MKIDWEKGNKGKGDRKILFTSDGEKEPVTIFKLALLINQLALNEKIVHEETIERTGIFLFERAIVDALKMGKLKFDWAEEKNKELVIKWCKTNFLRIEPIEKQLQKVIQKRLEEYENT